MRTLFLLPTILLCAICSFSWAEEKTLRINVSADPNGAYTTKMIQLALKHIDKKYKLSVGEDTYSARRIMEEIDSGGLDIFWASANAELETKFEPVRIPLYKGLLGYRIFIINKNNQAKFDNIRTIDDLKKITIGQGKTWADTDILVANNLNVVKVNKYDGLFYMLDGGRFDAFARGVHEPFRELEAHSNLKDLTIEKNLLLVYKMPFYLFVSKNNKALAHDLEAGLTRAIEDGSFNDVFFNDPSVKDVLAKANMKNRRIFKLDNPTLSKETPVDRKELWFDPQESP